MGQERGTLTKIVFGGVTANVALLKASGKPTEAQHETRRVLENVTETVREPRPGELAEIAAAGGAIAQTTEGETIATALADGGIGLAFDSAAVEQQRQPVRVPDDPMGGAPSDQPVAPPPPDAGAPALGDYDGRDLSLEQRAAGFAEPGSDQPVAPQPQFTADVARATAEQAETRKVLRDAIEQHGPVDVPAPPPAPATIVEQGVWIGEGDERTWVDLTDELASIDRCSKLEGLTVVKCVPASAVPRMQVRDSSWIAPNAKGAGKVLRLIWHGLHDTRRAAVVVYSKRTNQALGMVQAVGTRNRPALALIELEWAQNMRDAPSRARDPIAAAEVSEREVAAARSLVEALSAPASVIDTLRDERLAKRAELLGLAREGKLGDYEPPPEPEAEAEGDDLAAAMLAAAGR